LRIFANVTNKKTGDIPGFFNKSVLVCSASVSATPNQSEAALRTDKAIGSPADGFMVYVDSCCRLDIRLRKITFDFDVNLPSIDAACPSNFLSILDLLIAKGGLSVCREIFALIDLPGRLASFRVLICSLGNQPFGRLRTGSARKRCFTVCFPALFRPNRKMRFH
jgi:hypothetical protein